MRLCQLKNKNSFFLIEAQTGCTCCSSEDHFRGPYKSKSDAKRRIEYYRSKDSRFWPLASQYARRGSYSVKEISFEFISKRRIILDDRFVEDLKDVPEFIRVNEDGTVKGNKEYFNCIEF